MKRILLALAIAASFALSANADEWRKVSNSWVRVDGGPTVTLVDYTATQSAWTILANCTSGSAAPLFVVPNGNCLGNWLGAVATATPAVTDTMPFVNGGVAKQAAIRSFPVRTVQCETAPLTISDTNEHDVLNCTIPGGLLGTAKRVRFYIMGETLSNASATLTLKVYYGNTTMYNAASAALGNSGTQHHSIIIDGFLSNFNSASVQWASGVVNVSSTGVTGLTTGYSGLQNAPDLPARMFLGTAAENSAGDLVFRVSLTLSQANTTNIFGSYTEFIP